MAPTAIMNMKPPLPTAPQIKKNDFKTGVYGYATMGVAVLDNRRILLGKL